MNGKGMLQMGYSFKKDAIQQGIFKNGLMIKGKVKVESAAERKTM
jgi:hypothetical protein